MKFIGIRLLASTALAIPAIVTASAAHAQQAQPAADGTGEASDGEEILVTGSRIARPDYVSQSPIVTTDAEDIQNSGVTTVDAYLVQAPQFGVGQGAFSNGATGGLGQGQAILNLRQLGSPRTLVLLDGRRAQPGNAQLTIDINTIPSLAIQGVETITGGASATYGSDAIAGVVNFKLRHSFDGIRISGQKGITDRGDLPTTQLGFIAGTDFADGRGRVMISGEYADRAPLRALDRSFAYPSGNITNQTSAGQVFGLGPTQAAVDALFATYGVAPGTVPRTTAFGVNVDGTLFDANSGVNFKPYGDPCVVTTPRFGFDGNCTSFIQNGLKRYAGLVRAEYEVSPALTVYAQGLYSHAFSTAQGPIPGINPAVPATNPFIPANLRTLLNSRANPAAPFVFVKRFLQDDARYFTVATDTWQGTIGATGNLGLGDWKYDASFAIGGTRATDRTEKGALALSALNTLVNAADGGASTCTGGLNIFGAQTISDSCLAYIRRRPVTRTSIDQSEAMLSLSGSLFELPAGPVQLAVTGNYRHTKYGVNPDPDLLPVPTNNNNSNIALVQSIPVTTGTVNVSEIAAELLVPILKDVPFFQSLNLNAGYRYAHYNLSGNNSTWKVGLDWRPFEPLLLRGGYQRAVRAPNIGELFSPPSTIGANLGATGDPCTFNSAFRTGAAATQVRALCIAQGVPAAVVDTYVQPGPVIVGVTSGNRNLVPETAKSYTIGGVFQPTFLGGAFDRMNISVDYYNIKIDGVIGTSPIGTVLNKCFNGDGTNPTYDNSNIFCQQIVRIPTGIDIVRLQSLNLGGYRTSGWDFVFDWNVPLGSNAGELGINLNANHITNFQIQTLLGDPFVQYAGTVGGAAYPRWKINGTLTYDIGAFQIGTRWRHISGMTRDPTVPTAVSTPTYDYFDLFGRIRVDEDFELRLGVTNVADKQPPQVGPSTGSTNAAVYDIVGRSFYVGFQAKF